jgi:hypothetical protein
VAKIATNATRIAVQAMSNSAPRVTSIPIFVDEVESTANASLENVTTGGAIVLETHTREVNAPCSSPNQQTMNG